MFEEELSVFEYVAVNQSGRRIKGTLTARSNFAAFESLKRDGLSPLRIQPRRNVGDNAVVDSKSTRGLRPREISDFLADLAALLGAGADIRAALSVLGARGGRPAVRALSRALNHDISGGGAVGQAFTKQLGKDHAFVGALIASGETTGDLAGCLQRGADMLAARIRLRDQLISSLSYPAFVFFSTIVAIGVILLFVIPSLTPLVEDSGAAPPLILQIMIGASNFLRSNFGLLMGTGIILGVGIVALANTEGLRGQWERLLLDGPARRTASGLIFGGFAVALGNMLVAGAPMSDALRLSIRSVRSNVARARLESVAQAVRQGEGLSNALMRVKPFPDSIARLAAVGEASGALGRMLSRAGKIEEDTAIRRIESAGRVLGPALIVGLGGLIGLIMGGLLSGVSQLGQSAIQ